ncbi:MAG: hypothetical protein HKN76_14495, partial [Saprospiraceae bacterium]|nr:hypothetical protein [Saprospiraceae bacterium]
MVGWVIIVLVVLFLAVILWLLLATITLTVDTTTNEYSIVWFGFFQGRLQLVGEKIYVIVRAPFFNKRFDLEQKILKEITDAQKPDTTIKETAPKPKHSSGKFMRKKLRKNWLRIIKSFQVRRFRMNIDTDNFITNSLLFPITYFAQMRGYQVGINYMGMQSVSLVIQNRLA